MLNRYLEESVKLLSELIKTPSFSRKENQTASIIHQAFESKGIETHHIENNIWVKNKQFDPTKKTVLLNSHHDTVKPNSGYTNSPFDPIINQGKLYGLGSNDAGASLIGLMHCFLHYYESDLPINLIFAASAEEEISGKNGMELLVKHLPPIWSAIVGEPTQMNMAVAEKGLVVIDATATGVSGHAARDEGTNAISIALKDIEAIHNYQFEKTSAYLGDIRKTVTVINAGEQHNVIPDQCRFTIDVRTTDAYSNDETLDILQSICTSQLVARSTRLRPSGLPSKHPFKEAALLLGISTYGSPTLSDQALMPWPSIKMGIGDSARSHTADEFVYLEELSTGIEGYIKFIETLASVLP